MNRPFLFLAGEYRVSQPAVFRRDLWQHSMTSRRLVVGPGGLPRRDNRYDEAIRGVIHYADVEDPEIRRDNLRMLSYLGTPCWPDPCELLELDDRHEVMRRCVAAGLVGHFVFIGHSHELRMRRPTRDMVVKTGNLHRGEGKTWWGAHEEIQPWEGLATIEPFFHGTSARVLIVEDRAFGLRFDNPNTWIKNAAGAEVSPWPDIPQAAVDHAWRVHRHFGLDVSGCDYIIEPDGTPRFLEYNQFPGVGATDEIAECARALFERKMAWVERQADERGR